MHTLDIGLFYIVAFNDMFCLYYTRCSVCTLVLHSYKFQFLQSAFLFLVAFLHVSLIFALEAQRLKLDIKLVQLPSKNRSFEYYFIYMNLLIHSFSGIRG